MSIPIPSSEYEAFYGSLNPTMLRRIKDEGLVSSCLPLEVDILRCEMGDSIHRSPGFKWVKETRRCSLFISKRLHDAVSGVSGLGFLLTGGRGKYVHLVVRGDEDSLLLFKLTY